MWFVLFSPSGLPQHPDVRRRLCILIRTYMAIDLRSADRFVQRHIGPSEKEIGEMLEALGLDSLGDLVKETVPAAIRNGPAPRSAACPRRARVARAGAGPRGEERYLPLFYRDGLPRHAYAAAYSAERAGKSELVTRSTRPTRPRSRRDAWKRCLNFQTMVIDLTGLEIANASLLDEGTAAAEAMMMLHRANRKGDKNTFFVSEACHPQTIEVVKARRSAHWRRRRGGRPRDVRVYGRRLRGAAPVPHHRRSPSTTTPLSATRRTRQTRTSW